MRHRGQSSPPRLWADARSRASKRISALQPALVAKVVSRPALSDMVGLKSFLKCFLRS